MTISKKALLLSSKTKQDLHLIDEKEVQSKILLSKCGKQVNSPGISITLATTATNPSITTQALKHPPATIRATIHKTAIFMTITVKSLLDLLCFNIPDIMSLYVVKPTKRKN